MKIKGIVSLHFVENSFCDYLSMKIKIKIPNKFFTKTIEGLLASSRDESYLKNEDYLDDCIKLLSDKNKIINLAKEFIKDYMDEITNNTNKDLKLKEISSLLKDFNTQKIEVEIEY